jgi:MFS family permease
MAETTETTAAPTVVTPPPAIPSSTAPADAAAAPAQDEAVPRYVVLLAMCAALNSCNLGYDIGVNSGVGPHLQAKGEGMNLSNLQLELFFGIFGLAAMLGAAVAYTASDGLGRRKAFACTSATFIIGVLWTAAATSYASLMCGRFVTGLGVGLGLAIDPVYIAEVSPPKHRGRLVTWSETATNVGILLGFVSGFVFRNAGEAGWRSMLALGAIIPSVLLVLVYTFMPVRARRPSLRGAFTDSYLAGPTDTALESE